MFERIDKDNETVLVLEGTLDAVTAPELKPLVENIIAEERQNITIDASALKLIDSSGVGIIVLLLNKIRGNGGQVRIVGLKDQPRAIFRLLRLDRVFPV